jgi:predicted ATP-grasp superfamily ATP-dependent carboligase
MAKVLVTDADYKHAVAAIRVLAGRGHQVVAGADSRCAQGFYSRYCQERLIYPPPSRSQEFIAFLCDYLRKTSVDVLLPIGYWACHTVAQYQQEIAPLTHLAIADWPAMRIASHKKRSLALAQSVGIAIPHTYATPEEIVHFPVVVKGSLDQGRVCYANSPAELRAVYEPDCVIQDYIEGEGYGICALLNHGRLRACCMHRRIREFPRTGGASTMAETVADPELRQQGVHLLEALQWHGVAMVEFKKDQADGRYKLLEINPKFWGSLELAIAAGVDFPNLTVAMALEGDVAPVPDANPGVRFQWIFQDLLHAAAKPGALPQVLRDMTRRNVVSDIDRSDLKLFFVRIFCSIKEFIGLVLRRRLRYPQGRPRKAKTPAPARKTAA